MQPLGDIHVQPLTLSQNYLQISYDKSVNHAVFMQYSQNPLKQL